MRNKIIQIKSEVVFLQQGHDEHLLGLVREHMGDDMEQVIRDRLEAAEGNKEAIEELREEVHTLRGVADRAKRQASDCGRRLAEALDDLSTVGGHLPFYECRQFCARYREAEFAGNGKEGCANYSGRGTSKPCLRFDMKVRAEEDRA